MNIIKPISRMFRHTFDVNKYYRLQSDNGDGTGEFIEIDSRLSDNPRRIIPRLVTLSYSEVGRL